MFIIFNETKGLFWAFVVACEQAVAASATQRDISKTIPLPEAFHQRGWAHSTHPALAPTDECVHPAKLLTASRCTEVRPGRCCRAMS